MSANSLCGTRTRRRPTRLVLTTFLLFATGSLVSAQSTSTFAGRPGGSASGALTVTATVVASVGVVIGPDGEPKLLVANATDAADNLSRLLPLPNSNALHGKASGRCAVYAGRSQAFASCGGPPVQPRMNVTSTQ